MRTRRRRWFATMAAVALPAAGVLPIVGWGGEEASPLHRTARFRRPVAACLFGDGRLLAAANRRSGTVTLIETAAHEVLGEFPVGETLTDIAAGPGGRRLLAVDRAARELVVLALEGRRLAVRGRIEVARDPVSVTVSPQRGRCVVASLWSRRLTVFELSALLGEKPRRRVVRTVGLPFAPRVQQVLPEAGKLVAADAFGGRIAVVDLETGKLESVRPLHGHNIRGMRVEDGRLLITHQILGEDVPTTLGNIRAGRLMRNVVRALPLSAVLDPEADLNAAGEVFPLGGGKNGAADPAGIATDPRRLFVALSGTGELGVVDRRTGVLRRLSAGERPTAVLRAPNGWVYVVNTLSDSISVFAPVTRAEGRRRDEGLKPTTELALGPTPEDGPRERGERLFFDARLSYGGWLSCHSCHTDGHTCGLLADTLGDGDYGAPKRVLSLRGVGVTDRWAWNGGIKELQDQVHKAVRTTMRGEPIADGQASDLVAFLHTLRPAPPVDPPGPEDSDLRQVARGRRVFERRGCAECHTPFTYTTPGVYDVGIEDERGRRRFNPPSLRGVSQRKGYFHDNRAARLEEVFTEYGHRIDEPLSDRALADLLRFLRSL